MADAPSTSGGAADAASTPTPAPAQNDQGGAQSPRLDTPGANEKKSASSLPGVLNTAPEDQLDAEIGEKLFGKEQDAGDRKTRLRGPDGKFIKVSGEEPVPDARPELPEGAEPEPQPDEPQSKFKFAGEEWDSAEAAEQNFKTLRGMHKANQAKLQKAEVERSEYVRAYDAWKTYAEQQAVRVAELEKGGTQPRVQSGSGVEGQDLSDADISKAIDWDAYNYIATKGSLAKGGEYLIGQVMELVRGKMIPQAIEGLRAELMQKLAPFEQQSQNEATVSAMTAATQQLQSLKTHDGREAFPELQDLEKLEKIGYYWAREARDEADLERRKAILKTPAGLMNAVALYRLIESLEAAPAPPTPPVPTAQPTPAPSATLDVRGDEGFRPGSRSGLQPGISQMISELGRGEMIDTHLGFARNRR